MSTGRRSADATGASTRGGPRASVRHDEGDEPPAQRAVGLIYPDTASRAVFLGTLTVGDERRAIRMRAGVVFTNPDMLHTAILPNEEQWRTFFAALRVVVVDELQRTATTTPTA